MRVGTAAVVFALAAAGLATVAHAAHLAAAATRLARHAQLLM
jgi:hypothetical protein